MSDTFHIMAPYGNIGSIKMLISEYLILANLINPNPNPNLM